MTAPDRTADELAIRNLLAELAWHADHAPADDLDGYIACFTEDAQWTMFGDVRKGHDDLRAGAVERRESGMMGPGSGVRHFLGASFVTFDGPDSATARSHIQAYNGDARAPVLFIMGEYHDRFARTAAGWKLAQRDVDFDW
jgi:3-phenylpropionate/cinnamic acid dioxygenase small subunit